MAPTGARAVDLSVGPVASVTTPGEGTGGVLLGLGLFDFVALRAHAQGGYGRDGGVALLGAEAVLAIDVLTWVPEASIGAALRLGDEAQSLAVATLGVRRYLSIDWSVGGWAACTYDGDRLRPMARFALLLHL